MANTIEVGSADSGQQLARFLERRLNLPRSLAHKWLRTGQVRVNGKRSRPDRALEAGDILRLPPWAESGEALRPCFLEADALGGGVRIVFQDDEILVLDKPYGLPMHGGTRHNDSLICRIKAACGEGFYVPAPAHRLDLHASGLLLCGKTHAMQTSLHALFRETKPELQREYLCWSRGNAATDFAGPVACIDWLATECGENNKSGGSERTVVVAEDMPGAKRAMAFYQCLEVRMHEKYGMLSLIKARLLTGRKHQIRAQLASRGFPLLGDWRYGGSRLSSMMLHASRVALPTSASAASAGVFISTPPWTGFFAVEGEHA